MAGHPSLTQAPHWVQVSGLMERFYEILPFGAARYEFVDVRGWIGEDLWTDDGVHMRTENFREQAHQLWDRVFRSRFGCDALGATGLGRQP